MRIRSLSLYLLSLLVTILLALVYDLFDDYHQQTKVSHLYLEFTVLVLILSGIVLLIFEFYKGQRELDLLTKKLDLTQHDLSESRRRLTEAGRSYMELVQQQFDTWALSPSERQVAILILKGLSLFEIATIRQTREKTVRQQASSIYGKSKLSGRHELAAWFFEDLLE